MNQDNTKNLTQADIDLEILDFDLTDLGSDPEKRQPYFKGEQSSGTTELGANTITAYSRLAIRLERELSRENGGSSLLVMAAEYDRVAVEAVTELAWHLAEDLGRNVLMVDGGFNDMGLTRALGGEDNTGIMDLLSTENLTESLVLSAIRKTRNPRVAYIPVGLPDQGRSAPVRARALNRFLSITQDIADFVIIQGPVVAKASRALAFGSQVDAVLLVTLEGESSFGKLAEAQQILNDSGAERIGLLVGASRSHSKHK